MYRHIQIPAEGAAITVNADKTLNVPVNPIIPYIEGDGTGVDIAPVMMKRLTLTGSTMRWVRAPSGVGGQLFTIASSGSIARTNWRVAPVSATSSATSTRLPPRSARCGAWPMSTGSGRVSPASV